MPLPEPLDSSPVQKGNSGSAHPPISADEQNQSDAPMFARERQAKERAESLLRTAAHLNAQLDLQAVCEAICEEAGRTIGAPSAVMLFNKTQNAFVPASVRDMPRDYDKRYIPTMRSIYDRHVAEMGTLFLFTDAQATPDLPNHALYREVNMRTIGIASLIREGEVLGLLKVYSFGESRTFDENELALLQGLANQGAQAISNARFHTESQRRLAKIQSLRQIDMAILGSSEANVSLNVVLDQVVSQLDVDAASVLLLHAHTRMLRYTGGRGFRTATPSRTDWHLGEGLAGRVALERRMIHVPNLERPDIIAVDSADPEFKLPELNPPSDAATHSAAMDEPRIDAATGSETESASKAREAEDAKPTRRSGVLINEGFVSYYGVPLIASGQVKGVLEVWHRSPLRLDEEQLEFLETLAGQAAIAVDNASLFRDVQRSNDELVLAYDSTLEGWSAALDLRDKETEGHSQRVTDATLRLATHMGLYGAQLLQIRRGALLHDIGKMGIPDNILLKPGPLTDEEWVVMKKHPTYALELLSPIGYLRPALEIPYAHHEKWDGSGYPLGLSGKQIPLAARIFAVIDVMDALGSDRPYRKGWPIERVLQHIRDGSGTHFDPQVVEKFLQLHSQNEAEKKVDARNESHFAATPIGGLPQVAEFGQDVQSRLQMWDFTVENANDAVLVTTPELAPLGPHIVYVNSAFTRMTGYKAHEVIGLSPRVLQGPLTNRAEMNRMRSELEAGRSFVGEAINYTKDGRAYYMEWSVYGLKDADGQLLNYVAVQRDISARKRYEMQIDEQARLLAETNQQLADANARLSALSLTDSLTGAYNHRALHQKMGEEIARATRDKMPLSLLLLDVDSFKSYNDTYGHPAGDEALQKIAQLLQQHKRQSDIVARHGGEEFAVLLPQTDRVGALALAEGLRVAVENASWPLRAVTISVGVATLADFNNAAAPPETASDLMSRADAALYSSKEQGRNRVS
jgi:diguanylate cyclase (GGDEF)-like protein/PAS domain S-box-containing protein